MSKVSYGLIAIMVLTLLYMGGLRGYQFYARKAAQWEEERQAQQDAFSFQQVPISLAPPQAQAVSRPIALPPQRTAVAISTGAASAPEEVSFSTASGEIFLEDAPLSEEQRVVQAQDTLRSIVQDYQNEPEIKAFNEDLKRTTHGQAADLSALGGGDLRQVLKDNPQIEAVVSKHMQNPDFARKVQEILSNPQFVQSVKQLQQSSGTKK